METPPAMKIGIISDTHDHHENVLAAVKIFNQRQVLYILHAGDMVSPFTAKAFAELKTAKFIAVFGNNEGERTLIKNTVNSFGGEIHDYCYKDTIDGRHVFMTHTQHYVQEAAQSQMYDLVIYGHTHKQDIRRIDKTLIVNPGETTDWITGDPHVIILELDDMTYEVIPIKHPPPM